jgi:hypothetical protein
MYITANDKFYIVTSIGKNKFHYYFTVSEFNELPTEENYNPISEVELKWENIEKKTIEDIYNYLLTLDNYKGGILNNGTNTN